MGKSAILSEWLARREATGTAVPHHFVRRQVADWDRPGVIAVSLATQIEAAFPHVRDIHAEPERRLIELLGRVSRQVGASGRLCVVVDGLDETRAEPGENPLPRFLPHVVPPGIRVLCATRPTYPYLNWIEARSPVRRLDLDDPRWASSNDAVVRRLWAAVAPDYQPPLSAETLAAALARAEGNVLHAVMLHDAMRGLPAEQRRIDRMPRGLKGLIGDVWDRAASHEVVRVGLGLLCAAREALTLEMLAELAEWSYDDNQCFVREARQLLLEEPTNWGIEAYRPRHDWVRELIAERLGTATVRAHHATLLRKLATWPPPVDPTRRAYAVRHALAHRIAVDDWCKVRELASNLSYLEARVQIGDPFAVEQELIDAKNKCPELAVARDLSDLSRALAHESHWIRNDPKGAAALIWNGLARSGWTEEELDTRVTIPAEAVFLRVRHAASRQSASLERTLDGHAGWVRACTVTPDNRHAISASLDGTLKIWGLDAGHVVITLDNIAGSVNGCAVTPDGRRIVSAHFDGSLRIWDLDTGRLVSSLWGHTKEVIACTVTPNGRNVVSASVDQTLKIWDIETGRELMTLDGHSGWVGACAATPDGRYMVSASHDRTLKIWDLASGRALTTLGGHADRVTACAVMADARRIVSASSDRTLKIWDLHTARILATLHGHADAVRACAVTPDSRHMISASDDRTLKVWDLEAGCVLTTFEGHADRVTACVVTPDGRRVVSASSDHTLKIWDLGTEPAIDAMKGHADGVSACSVSLDGTRAVSASSEGTFIVWDPRSARMISSLHSHCDGVRACAMTPDGQHIISGSNDGTLKVWNLHSGQVRAALRGHAAGVTACVVTTDGRRIVSGSNDGTLRIWDLITGNSLITLRGHTAWVTACAVAPDGRRIISGSNDGTVKVWDLDAAQVLITFQGHTQGVRACAAAPDGRRMISGSDDGTLKIWDLNAGHVLATLQGHAQGVRACAVTPDGRYVVSGADDRTIKVWSLDSLRCLVTHRGDAAFQCLATTSGGIIASDRAGTIWFFDMARVTAPGVAR
jgi:WD40 repeat protein